MNVPGILNALTALSAATGSKAPSPNANQAQPAASFRQALSQEVAQRQPAPQPAAKPPATVAQHAPRPQEAAKPPPLAKAPAADKAKPAQAAPDDEAASAPSDAPTAATAAQASEAKPEDKQLAQDSAASLADIPGAPQAALMMQLMNPAPAVAPVADTAVATDAAAIPSGKTTGKDAASEGPLDLRARAVAGKDAAAGATVAAGQAATPAGSDLHAAFARTLTDAASQQATQTLSAAQTDAPASAPAALAALQAAVQAVHAPATHVDKLTPAVGTPAWDQALGQKIVWMAQGGEQSATLTMNPPDLGPMQVVLSVSNNQATVDFTAAQPEVREALEAALPRLREMMSESGVQLGQANVSAGSQQQFAGFGGQNKGGNGARGGDGLTIDDAAPQLRQGVVRMARDGAVDTFA
jgi:flagellar hook-length control protein FliK